MRNTTTILLVTLMLTSILAGLPMNQLNNVDMVDNTSGRAGADVDILAITSPDETVCTDNIGCRNELLVGDDTTFEVVMRNIGDGDIEEMSYTVAIYLTDSSGGRGMMAKDANGLDLTWTNDVAVCPDASSCDQTEFLASSTYGNGAVTLTTGGSDIVWTPAVGQYLVVVSIDSDDDSDPSNDEEEIFVIVRDWADIEVDLCWTNADGCLDNDAAVGTNADTRSFQLTVTADGSTEFNPREVNVSLEFSGMSAASAGGMNLGTDGASWVLVAGSAQTVEVTRNATDDTFTESSRKVVSYQTEWTLSGSITPDSNADGQYTIEASLLDFTQYGQADECTETWLNDPSDPSAGESSSPNFCETIARNDDNARSDGDDIYGFTQTFHDIRIDALSVAQGYSADGTGNPSMVVRDGMDADLRVGATLVHAAVEHSGSDVTNLYDWEVVFTVTSPDGTEATYTEDTCPSGLQPSYSTHKLLGADIPSMSVPENDLVGSACVMLVGEDALVVGEYTFDAELVMKGTWDSSAGETGRLIENVDGEMDEKGSNNVRGMTLDVINNNPEVISLTMYNTGDVVVSQSEPLEFDALAFDADCVAGDCLTYEWSIDASGQTYPLAMCGGEGAQGAICSFNVLPQYMTSPQLVLTVTDDNGASVSDTYSFQIWNDVTAEATSGSGVGLAYSIQYLTTSQFTVALEDVDVASYAGWELPGYTGNYDAVAAMTFTPATSYEANGILTQNLVFTVPKSLEATSLWYVQGTAKYLIDGTPEDSATDSTLQVYTYDIATGQNSLTSGTFVLFGGSLEEAVPPAAGITGFSAIAEGAGDILITWDVTSQMSLGERFVMEICMDEAGCDSPTLKEFTSDVKTYNHPGTFTTHGASYVVTVEVCNDAGCNDQIGQSTVVADKEVDGDVAMGNLLAQGSDDGATWAVTWTVTGDMSDVVSWRICYSENSDVASIPTEGNRCTAVDGASATAATVNQPTFTGTQEYYFVGIAVDELGNSKRVSEQATPVNYRRDADFSNTDDGNGTIDDGSAGDAELPGWTLPAIGGVVLVAIIIGAVIVTRGGGGGGGDKDWDY